MEKVVLIVNSTGSDIPAGYSQPYFLGSGGWAQVFRCIDDRNGREVALKLFNDRLGDPVDGAESFRSECRVAALLSAHPGVVRLHAAGITATARPWLVMDLAPGGTLADTLTSAPGGVLSVARAIEVTIGIADTMSWAHRLPSPVIHGDIKPANVLLDGSGRPLLSDFGVATHLGSRHSVTVAQFTQSHAAPEVLHDGRASVSSDIWSLGAMLCELLTGAPPFTVAPGEGIGAFIEKVQRGMPEGALPASVPAPVASVIRGALTVERSQRTASMSDLASQLRAAQRALGLPVTVPLEVASDAALAVEVSFTGYVAAVALTTAKPLHVVEPVAVPLPTTPRRRTAMLIAAGAAVLVVLTGAGIAVASSGRSHRHITAGGSPGTRASASAQPSTSPAASPTATAGPAPTPTSAAPTAAITMAPVAPAVPLSNGASVTGGSATSGSGRSTGSTTGPATPTAHPTKTTTVSSGAAPTKPVSESTYANWSWSSSVGVWEADQDLTVTYSDPYSFWGTDWAWPSGSLMGYLGLQTNGNRFDGSVGDMAIFSVWGAHTATAGAGSTCQMLSGGIESCRLPYTFHANHSYRLRVWRLTPTADGAWWGAYIEDESTGTDSEVGAIAVASSHTLLGASASFIQFFGTAYSCGTVPKAAGTWSAPQANYSNGAYTVGGSYASKDNGGSCPGTAHSSGSGASIALG